MTGRTRTELIDLVSELTVIPGAARTVFPRSGK